MKTILPRIAPFWAVLLAGLTIAVSAAAQEGLVMIQGRKASASGLLVKVKNGADAAQMLTVKGGLSQMAMKTMAEFRTNGLMLVGKDAKGLAGAAMTNAELERKAKELMATGLYEYVEPDWIVTVSQTPADTAFTNGSLWGLRNTGQNGGVAGVDVNAQPAWALTTGSPTVIVGVVDTGIRYTHQDLAANMWVNQGEIPGNGVDDDANGYIDDVHGINGITNSGDPMDDNDHGTHCAGTIGATANDAGQIVGVAWNVKLMALKFLSASGSGSTSDAIKCIDYGVEHGAHILSNSWGGGGYSQALRDSIAAASAAGVLFVAAAGNSSSNNDLTQNYPSNYDPANVVAVAAVDRTGALASFSSYGATTVDVGAPGVAILSSTAASDTSYASFNGTSMATPHVAGVAALIKSHFPSATMLEIKNRLLATTRPLASLAGRTVAGGIVDAHAALTVAADGVLELRVAAGDSPLRSGRSTAFYVTVSDLTPITGATVTAALDEGTPVPFLDNGVAPDVTANDGIYSANLTVPAAGSSTTLNVTASHGAAPVTEAFPFSIISPPANDDFANRILLAAGTTQTTGANRLATFETGEPRYPGVAGTKSVWWEWAAGTSGSVTVTTSGSSYDTTLAVYSGSGTLASLTHLGSNDDYIGLASSVTFTAASGSRYYFQVNGYGGSEGSITLNYPAPANVNSPPVIVTQPVGAILVAGDPLSLSVTAAGTAPLSYQWALDDSDIPGATAATHAVGSVTEADQGNYTVTITNAFGSLTSAAAFIGVDPISVRPPNDTFVNAEPLAGATGRVSGSNLRASGEAGEPNHAGASAPIESVWYRWTAPADGILSLDTYGSSLDTTLAVYTGPAVNALTLLAANNDSGGVQSFVSLEVEAGQVLSIAVDGAGTAESLFSLNYLFQPAVTGLPNDAFASRKVVSGAGGTFSGSNITATGEAGEPVHEASAPPTASAWWAWTAPENGVAVIDTLGSDFDTVLAVYTGAEVSALTRVASNDDAGGPQSRVAFPCSAGTAYAIAVDGQGAAEGLITLNITSGATEPEIVVEQPAGTELVDGGAGVSWGDVAAGENVTRTFTVRNTGGARLTSLSSRIEGANAADFVLTTPPSAPLSGGASTTFTVHFTPAGLGAHTAVLRLASNDADENPFDISLSGSGVPPAPEIVLEQPAGTSLVDGSVTTAFGSAVVGSSASRTYTVRNIGNATLSGLAVTFGGTHAADFSVTTPPAATVAPGGSTSFTVSFAPGGFGARTAALMLASNDADEHPFDVALSGSGIATPPVVRTINATDRGWYRSNGFHGVTNTNYLTGYSSSDNDEARSFFVFAVPILAANETVVSAELRLVNPSNGYLSADATETLEVRHVSTAPSILIAGTAGTAGFADLQDGELLGGPLNVGASDNGTTVAVPLNDAAIAEIHTKSGAQIAFGGGLTTITRTLGEYVFGYSGTTGNMADTQLVLTTVTSYTDAEIVVEQPAGTGLVDGGAGVSFGQITPGGSADRVFTIRNVGIYDLTGLDITLSGADAGDFSVIAAPAAPLAPAGSTNFTVRYTAATPGSKNAVLSIASNDPDENPFEIALTGTAVAPAPEIVVEQPAGTSLVDGSAVVDFGYRLTGADGSLVFTVRNTGTLDLTGLEITIDGAHAADFSVSIPPAASVAPGGSTSFTVRFSPVATGLRTAALHLANNDLDENPFDIALNGRGYDAPAGLDFKIVSLGTTGSAVVDHNSLTGDDRGGIAVTADRVFVTGDSATSRHALDLTGGASLGRVSNGLCSDIGTGTAYVLAHNGLEITGGSSTVSQLIELNPLTGALTGTILPLSQSFTTSGNSGVFSGNGRVVVHNGTRVYDILVPSGVVTDMGPMSPPVWYRSESWAIWGVAEYFEGHLHLAYRSNTGSTIVRSRVPDGQVQTISTFSNLSDMASWTVSPFTGRWYFHHEYSSQFGGSSETLGHADASFETGPPTQPPVITSPLAATAFTGSVFSYQIRASNSPTSYQAAGLPAGLAVNTATGLISGNAAVVGVHPVTISATNVVGTTEETLTITVADTLTAFFDDFDPGIDASLWSDFGGTVTANTAGQAAGSGSTGNSLHFDGEGSRFATTVPVDTRAVSALSFLVALGNGSSPWEYADSGEEVVVEYSSGGATFTQIGGPYSNRAWQLVTVGLPEVARTASTRFRWRQLSHNGGGFDHWAIEDVRIDASVAAAPEIVVEQPAGSGLVDGVSTVNFGSLAAGSSISLTFTVRNLGSADLAGLAVTLDGVNADDFTVTTPPPATVIPGAATTFVVRFTPGAAGSRSAALQIASNDADENPFDLALAGTGIEMAGTAALFANGSFVDTSATGEMEHTRAALTNAGYIVTTFTGITAADWNAAFAADVVVVPELEVSSLSPSAAAITAINNHLAGGKGLVLMGDIGNNDTTFLNALRGWHLVGGSNLNGTTLGKVAGVPGFAHSPATLAGLNATYSVTTASLPPGTQSVYQQDANTAVFLNERVGFMAYDWYAGVDNNWTVVLGDLITEVNRVVDGPEIVVERPLGTNLSAGVSTAAFGYAPMGGEVVSVFTIRNTGNEPLTGVAVSVDGAHAADFVMTAPPAGTVAPGGSTTFTMRFSPSVEGNRAAALRIASNDADENPFDIALTGTTSQALFEDDFDPGIDTPLWSAFGGTVTASTAGQAAGAGSTGNSLHFDGGGSRFATTIPLNTTSGGGISFKIALANGGVTPWETADSGEDAVLEYSNDGTLYTQIGGPYSNRAWQSVVVGIPVAAQTVSTRFRWRQLSNSGSGFDHWAIEDVRIGPVVGTVPEIALEQPAGSGLTDGVSTVNFGSVATGTNDSLTFTVRNLGSADLTGLAVTLDGANAADFTVTTPPAATVIPGATTTFVVRFAPGATGGRAAALHLASNDADENPFDIALSGTGFIGVPEIAVEQPAGTGLADGVSTVNAGYVSLGSSASLTFTVRNAGGADLTGLAVTFSGANAEDFSVSTQPAPMLEPGGVTTFVVSFTPRALGGHAAVLHLASNDADENPFDVSLAGSGFPAGAAPIGNYDPFPANSSHSANFLLGHRIQVTSHTTLLAFGVDVRSTGAQASFGLYADVGGAPAALVAQTGAFQFDRLGRIETPPVEAVALDPGYYWIMAVFNGSTSVGRDASALTQIAYRSLPFTAALPSTFGTATYYSGQGFNYYLLVGGGEIAVEQPAGVDLTDEVSTTDFGIAAGPVTRRFTLRNTGSGFLSGISLSLDGAHAADFSVAEPSASSVAPGVSTTFAIRFTPSALGPRAAALRIASNDTDENPFDIALTATAITPAEGLDGWLPPALPDRTPEGMPYHDGLPNLLKYAFNLDPSMPHFRGMTPGPPSGLPSIRWQKAGLGAVLRFEFIRRVGSGLIYTPQKSYSLSPGEWMALFSPPVVTPVDEFWERVVHEEVVDPLTVPACFGRVEVTLP